MDQALRRATYDRSLGMCAWCGGRIRPEAWEFHHRRLRSRGGADTLANGVALCTLCHMLIHRHPQRATNHGFMVSAYADPAEVPLNLHRRRWVDPVTYDLIEGESA